MSPGYTTTRLWREAFSDNSDDCSSTLAAIYRTAWQRACEIAKRISTDAHGLTLHDERHFLGLWHAADLLVSPEAKLTTIETFIFGISILIHDAAHTTLAYSDGLSSIKNTPEWTDNLEMRLSRSDGRNSPTAVDIDSLVLFDTVRAIHAKQAEKILHNSFKQPAFDDEIFLIDDITIRNHLSEIIGKIAASHHWETADLQKVHRSLNVVSPYNKYGAIRPMLLAALMRTADAIQIDNARAPDFEFAAMAPKGASKDHWIAQNRLAIGADTADSEALLINSTAAFQANEARAWWVAYDLAKNADRELRNTDALLSDYSQPRFNIKRVKDIISAQNFSVHVKTEGWIPVDTSLKISDTKKIIELFGGAELYGNDPIVPLRELIQNSIDAVRARRLIDKGYDGKVFVEIEASDKNDEYTLRISDDGLGMSLAMLTGPLLTFGESGWSSSTLIGERVGLIGKRPRHIGKYGIGFFSVFMIADHVKVTSRAFDQGGNSNVLEFSSGTNLRPSLRTAMSASHSIVTEIELKITASVKDKILNRQSETQHIRFGGTRTVKSAEKFSMHELIGVICPSIDVNIETYDCDSAQRDIVSKNWEAEDTELWLCRINDTLPELLPAAVRENIHLVDIIKSKNQACGRAAISPSLQDFSVYTIGGLANKKVASVKHELGIVGCIDRAPAGPKRDRGSIIDEDTVAGWATSQANQWAKTNISDAEKNIVAAHTAKHGGDCAILANAIIDNKWRTVNEIHELLRSGVTISAPIRSHDYRKNTWRVSERVNLPSGLLYHPDDIVVDLNNVMISGLTEKILPYWTVTDKDIHLELGLIGILCRHCLKFGDALSIEGKNVDFGYYNGETIRRERRFNGERIVIPAVELKIASKCDDAC